MLGSVLQTSKQLILSNKALFDIVFINLESRKDRREHMEKMLVFGECRFSRFNAVNGKDLLSGKTEIDYYTDSRHFEEDVKNYKQLDPYLYGMAGCKLSHQILWDKIAKSKKNRPTLILEDDVELSGDFINKLNSAIVYSPDEWDMIILSHHFHLKPGASVDEDNSLVEVAYFFERHSYLVKDANAAHKMMNAVRKNNFDVPVDLCLGQAIEKDNLKVYAFSPFLSVQRRDHFGTDIPSSEFIGRPPLIKNSLFVAYKQRYQTKYQNEALSADL